MNFYLVMRGLDPRIHDEAPRALDVRMDCRVKPGNDDECFGAVRNPFFNRLNRNRSLGGLMQAIENALFFSPAKITKLQPIRADLNQRVKS